MATLLSFSQAYSSKTSFHGACKPVQASRFLMNLKSQHSPRCMNCSLSGSLPPEKLEVFKSLELMTWGEESFLTMLKPVEESWQPQDLLPDPASEEFLDSIKELKARAAEIPDEYLVCLVGNMVTEEALPTYQSMINTAEGFRDETGASPTPWARWTKRWTAEENRHGDLLNKYLYLTGRCDMRQIEKTIQYLLGAGMDSRAERSPYCGFIYTSFQERATFISHGNTARYAKKHGDTMLAKICGLIAADEKRHEMAYTKLIEKLFQYEPDTTMQAFATMMKKRVRMPALHMYMMGRTLTLHFAAVSHRLGVYMAGDYADMVEFFVERWNVEDVRDLSGEGRRAQEYVCRLPEKFRKMGESVEARNKRKKSSDMVQFSWIFNKSILI